MVTKNTKRLIAFVLLLSIGFGAFLLFSDHFTTASCAPPVHDSSTDQHWSITSISPPEEATLFGKKIPLQNWEIRERFEREFYYNYSNADQLLLWWKRLGRWEPMIDSMLSAAGLPQDFKYLMVAESGVRNVQSPAKANGFWQFIPPTAQKWGLRVDDEIDERLDPILSTQAAIRYLSKLKNQFNGDYFLVSASYNMSEDNVEEVLSYQHQSSFWNLYVNEETMRYLLRIAIIKEFFEHGARYGLHFESAMPYKMHSVKVVSVTGPIASIADWAVSQGYSYKDIKIYNPRFIARDIPKGTFEIRLPATDADRTTVSN
jgi:hypothetical protein